MRIDEQWWETDLLDDAIENLEMVRFLLESTYDAGAKWKWITIATYQALYEFAVYSVRGTNDLRVIKPSKQVRKNRKKFGEIFRDYETIVDDDAALESLKIRLRNFLNVLKQQGKDCDDLCQEVLLANRARLGEIFDTVHWILREVQIESSHLDELISLHEALRLARVDCRLNNNSQPLVTTSQQDDAIQRLSKEFRNHFVHRRPGIWAIEVEALIECVRDVLPVIRFLAFGSNNILYHPEEQRSRTENAMVTVEKRFAAMPKIKKENDVVQVAEQGVEYAGELDSLVDEGGSKYVTSKDQLRSLLRQDGLLAEPESLDDIRPPISESRREELARIFSAGKPLSQIIIEDRD